MKQFFGAFLGSLLGVIITGVIVTLIVVFSVVSLVKENVNINGEHSYKTKANSVLKLNLNDEIHERGIKQPFADINLGPFTMQGHIGLNDLLANLKKAKTDQHISGIYLDIANPSAGFATLEEIRNALLDFKSSGKFVYAYAEGYSQKAYYVASVANKVYLNPQGMLEIKGLSSQMLFFKSMLEKLNVDVQIFRHGKFKSAIEPFMLDKMSEANRTQVETYLGAIWNHMLKGISAGRNISTTELNTIANDLAIRNPEDAVTHRLVDELKYEDEVLDAIKKRLNIRPAEKIHFVSLEQYMDSPDKKSHSKHNIAVIYAEGEIVSGESGDDNIGSETLAKAIREARLDSTVKAIVFRVNSPGGSALASDVIWREALLAKKIKPFIVSMSDVAASGGYYISCAADRIFAHPTTITGSIGVFGLLPNIQKALSEKLGIKVDTVNTNRHSDAGSILRSVTKDEHDYIQQSVEHIYDVFTHKVAQGRNMSQANVDSIGQGRVWSGADALNIRLVDELGGFDAALAYAAKQAKLTDYKIIDLPTQKDPIKELFKQGKDELENRIMQENLGTQYTYMKQLKYVLKQKGVQARIPYQMVIE